MPFKGVTFSGQNVTPKNDGGLYQAHYGDGILWGCSMAISGDDLVVQSGEFIMGGRVVQVDGATNVDLSGRTIQTGYIQVIMNADLSQGEGSQWYTTFVESATTTFPALTRDDINDTGTLYQLELAVIQVSGGNLTSIYTSQPPSPVVSPQVMRALDVNGDLRGKVDAYTENTNTKFVRTDINNNSLTGMSATDTDVNIFGNGGNVSLQPNGGVINCGGQLVGGVGVSAGTLLATTVNANTTVKVYDKTLTQGTYLCIVYLSMGCSSNTTGVINVTWAKNGGSGEAVDQQFTNTTSRKYIMSTWVVENATSVQVSLYAPSGVNLTGIDGKLRTIRLG